MSSSDESVRKPLSAHLSASPKVPIPIVSLGIILKGQPVTTFHPKERGRCPGCLLHPQISYLFPACSSFSPRSQNPWSQSPLSTDGIKVQLVVTPYLPEEAQ